MESTRRNFLLAAGGAAAAATVLGPARSDAQGSDTKAGGAEATVHTLPPLPYPYDALEPYMDARTVELHYTKHHAGYVKGLNTAESALADARKRSDFSLIQHWSRQAAFMGAGAFLHTLYWSCMAAPDEAPRQPSGELAEKLAKDFGSVAAFQNQFAAAAAAVEGSGWGVLAYRPSDKRLLVLQVENHQNLSPWNAAPILCVDVWEHAYYLQYQNRRSDFIEAWWNLVHWGNVHEHLAAVL